MSFYYIILPLSVCVCMVFLVFELNTYTIMIWKTFNVDEKTVLIHIMLTHAKRNCSTYSVKSMKTFHTFD